MAWPLQPPYAQSKGAAFARMGSEPLLSVYFTPRRWAALGLFFAHYNRCRKHKRLKIATPAMAIGLAMHAWSVRELLQLVCRG